MTSNCAFVLVATIFLCSPDRFAAAANVPKTDNNVLAQMKQDTNVCAAGAAFRDSKYAKICENFKFPSGSVTLDPANSEQFLCLGFYDRILRLCHLDTIRKSKDFVLPNDVTQFDAQVEKTLPKSDEDIEKFCQGWNNVLYPPMRTTMQPYVAQLEEAMKKHLVCLKVCTDGFDLFVPLCSVLANMDQLSNLTGVQTTESIMKPQPISPDAVQNANPVVETIAVDSPKPENVPTATNSQNTAPETGPEKEPEPAVPKNEKNAQTQQENLPKTGDAVSSQEVKKKEQEPVSGQHVENAAAAEKNPANGEEQAKVDGKGTKKLEESVKPVKEEQSAKETGGKVEKPEESAKKVVDNESQTKPSDSSNKAKTTEPVAAAPVDGPAAPGNRGNSGEAILDGAQGVLDEPSDVISQHTQDDPAEQFPDADPMDTGEGPLTDDDSEQTAIQPSEKRNEYIPRMASIPNEDDSHFFGYFTVIGVMCIAGYVGYHNKQKILAMVLEGRRSRGGRSRRRPSTANYRKLDCTLEEAVTSQCNSNVTHVIY